MKKNRNTKLPYRKGDVTAIAEATGFSFSMVWKVQQGLRHNTAIEEAFAMLQKSRTSMKKLNRKNKHAA